ncbi:hypothetical protein TanjilG_31849 [Lupinus angustifolius]|uniref:Uncharacterized protein n=2 Tax=Lupinus angustifolius TaxID=3871 RepID=A0A394D9A8_LUPAN|nr:PREDICTED: uncharacterized protein LOC109337614 isoform X2 [Lupinus angustifolius]OIW19975.1 hypothetical protein TanjilG_31849 [Lupinus angustifolius]
MILKDIMEEKQLNFNQPILSVRRFSSKVASETDCKRKSDNSKARSQHLPAYNSELKSGPVRNPGTVPFEWEKVPGRRKDESKSQTQAFEQHLIAPNLPPGRVSKLKQQGTAIKVTSVTEMRTGSSISNSQSVVFSKEKIHGKSSSDSSDGSEVYVDAFDTLSRSESFFMSCSSMSGLDDQEVIQPSKTFSNDRQTRDFMIDRFLPAAKAMTSDILQYASRRKPVVGQDQHKQVKKVSIAEKSDPLNQQKPKTLPHYTEVIGKEGSKGESGDCNVSENYTTTASGLFPRFCNLNPIPGLKIEDKVQSSALHGMQTRPVASHCETKIEHARGLYDWKKPVDSHSGSRLKGKNEVLGISEKSRHGIDSHGRGCNKLLASESTQFEPSCEGPAVEKTLYVDSVHKVKSHSSSFSKEMKGLTDRGGNDFDTLRRDTDLIKNPSIDSSLGNSKHLDAVDVKAMIQPKSSESFDSTFLVCSEDFNNGMQIEMTNPSKKLDSEKQGLTKPGIQGSDFDKHFISISRPKVFESKNTESESLVSKTRKKSDSLIQNSEVDLKRERSVERVDQECPQGSTHNPSTLPRTKNLDDGKIDLESQCLMKLGHQERPEARYLQLPSLKAPSESWLSRTLPTISSRNISSRSINIVANICARNEIPKATSLCPNKWENIVKSSNVHHGQLKFTEVLTSIPEG